MVPSKLPNANFSPLIGSRFCPSIGSLCCSYQAMASLTLSSFLLAWYTRNVSLNRTLFYLTVICLRNGLCVRMYGMIDSMGCKFLSLVSWDFLLDLAMTTFCVLSSSNYDRFCWCYGLLGCDREDYSCQALGFSKRHAKYLHKSSVWMKPKQSSSWASQFIQFYPWWTSLDCTFQFPVSSS